MRCKHRSSISLVTGLLVVSILGAPATGQVTARVNLGPAGAQSNQMGDRPAISANGLFVVFRSAATNLVAGDTNGSVDVFVRDRQLGTTERVSVDTAEVQSNGDSGVQGFAISADGRYVAFESVGTNLVAGDTNNARDVFVRDRQLGTTERVSVSFAALQGDQASGFDSQLSISGDGRFVAFKSSATNLVAGDTNALPDIYMRDRFLADTVRVSITLGGGQPDGLSTDPSVSADGRYVAFTSVATNLVAGDMNGISDIYLRDRLLNTTERVSFALGGGDSNGFNNLACISADGRYVAYQSDATNLIAGDTNLRRDIFVRDRMLAVTERVSIATGGAQGNDDCFVPAASPDFRYMVFYSGSTNLVAGDGNGVFDVFVRDRQSATTERVSLAWNGVEGNGFSFHGTISADGRYVSLRSGATNLVPGDTNGFDDVFVRDRLGAPAFTSLCHPGIAGVIACPCSNPPAPSGRGCNNSSNTGGALLSATGGTYLSSDTLVFTTSGEKPTSLSLLAQWIGGHATGVVFGQGVRCTSGTFKRLFSANAVGGSVTFPNFGAGDPSVSARSAAKGDTILAGQSRWYLVYYRDNTVLGGCPALSNFNATQTGQVTWSP